MIDTAHDIVTGRLRAEVLEAAGRLLGLAEPQALAHLECLLDPTHGLITDGQVDEASINTLIDLETQAQPEPGSRRGGVRVADDADGSRLGTGPRT